MGERARKASNPSEAQDLALGSRRSKKVAETARRAGARLNRVPLLLHPRQQLPDEGQVGESAHLLRDPAGGAPLRIEPGGREPVARTNHA